GKLQSLPLTFLGAMILGVAQNWPAAWGLTGTAWSEAAAFVVVLAALIIVYRPGSRARFALRMV
ncbi:MAG: hypothetical protein JOY80_04905, partial [Candidatus Dormibacteraeota bacterium]|nr:hypothetical protein [Candidatus Dormibacteraeota bacterium]